MSINFTGNSSALNISDNAESADFNDTIRIILEEVGNFCDASAITPSGKILLGSLDVITDILPLLHTYS